jgi:hypothetical protein
MSELTTTECKGDMKCSQDFAQHAKIFVDGAKRAKLAAAAGADAHSRGPICRNDKGFSFGF